MHCIIIIIIIIVELDVTKILNSNVPKLVEVTQFWIIFMNLMVYFVFACPTIIDFKDCPFANCQLTLAKKKLFHHVVRMPCYGM